MNCSWRGMTTREVARGAGDEKKAKHGGSSVAYAVLLRERAENLY